VKRIFIPTKAGSDWQSLLAKPKLHWKKGASAMTAAAAWEDAGRALSRGDSAKHGLFFPAQRSVGNATYSSLYLPSRESGLSLIHRSTPDPN